MSERLEAVALLSETKSTTRIIEWLEEQLIISTHVVIGMTNGFCYNHQTKSPKQGVEVFMPRETFETEIKQVKDEILVLGSMVEKAILDSVEALKKRDIKEAEKIFEEDKDDQQETLRDRKPINGSDRHATADGA